MFFYGDVQEFGVLLQNTSPIKSGGTWHYEIAHVFKVTSNFLQVDKAPISKEAHLAFHWIHPSEDELKKHNVMPNVAVQMLMRKV